MAVGSREKTSTTFLDVRQIGVGGILKPISWSAGGGLRVSQRGHFPRPHPCKWHFIHPNPSSILCVNSRGADGENRRQRRRKQAVFSVQEETEISRPFSFGGSQKLLMFKKKKKRQLFLHNMMTAGVLQLGRNNSRIRVKVESRSQMHNSLGKYYSNKRRIQSYFGNAKGI